MKEKMVSSRTASLMLVLVGLAFTGCTTGTPGVHMMGSAPMSDTKMPGKIPDDSH